MTFSSLGLLKLAGSRRGVDVRALGAAEALVDLFPLDADDDDCARGVDGDENWLEESSLFEAIFEQKPIVLFQ